MTKRFTAQYENGVFVPDSPVELPEHQRVSLVIEESPQTLAAPLNGHADDPMPAGGVELVDWWSRHQIQIDPAIAREIAENPEFDIENS